MVIIAAIALATLTSLSARGQQPREGDLLFACTDTANAITAVTSGIDGLPIDHVGIVHYIGGEQGGLPYVIEAISPAVCLTPLDTFVRRSPNSLLARVNVPCDLTGSTRRALQLVGKPYDDLYLPGDSAIYCSELVLMCYADTAQRPLFAPIAMSFHDATGRITPQWVQHYQARGLSVPEGAPGSNPGELSRRPQVTLIGPIHLKMNTP